MSLEEAVSYFGSGYRLCRALSIKEQNYTQWKQSKKIPLIQQLILEKLTQGKLKADDKEITALK